MRFFREAGSVLLQAGREFGKDDAMAKAAALAFYTALGMAPMLLLTFAIASFLPDELREGMIDQIEGIVDLQQIDRGGDPHAPSGNDVAKTIDEMMKSAQRRQQQMSAGVWSLVIGVATLLFSAGGVFAELQSALNKMWDVQPHGGAGTWVKRRLLSLGMLVAVLFIMLVSLLVSTAIEAMFPREGHVWKWTNWLVSLGVFTLIFALIYKMLPDVRIAWRDVWVGAAVTALLFAIGKYLIAIYLGHQSFTSSYGAAGSLIALLAWVYYSSNIVFFGAEVTQIFARRYGSGIHPYSDAHRCGASHKATPEGTEA